MYVLYTVEYATSMAKNCDCDDRQRERVFSDRKGETGRRGGWTQVSCKPLSPIQVLTFVARLPCDLTIERRQQLPHGIKHQDTAG